MDRHQQLANLLFPSTTQTVADFEKIYPPRNLPEGAFVTRIAPSPTGFFHIGTLSTALISERLAHQSGGVFFLRLEDTDQKRLVEGSVDLIVSALEKYLKVDEGQTHAGEVGEYGPYTQSARKHIYDCFIKDLIAKGHAYPCFATKEELGKIHDQQTANKQIPGIYGEFVLWRDRSLEEIKTQLDQSIPFVIRLRSTGDPDKKFKFKDLAKGEIEFPQNHLDAVLIKSDGYPTYHFAHLVDDYLMRVTHVIRTDEWLSSLPLHLELFHKAGFTPPKYLHASPVQKMDGTSRRKLSKRKDPEASIAYYWQEGYPTLSLPEYLINLSNSNFQNWRAANPRLPLFEYPYQIKGLQHQSGALLDLIKLESVAKDVISRMNSQEIYDEALAWANEYDPLLAKLLSDDVDYALKIFNIERSGGKPRKDLAKWSQLHHEIGFFYNELFEPLQIVLDEDLKKHSQLLINTFLNLYQGSESKEDWLQIMTKVGEALHFAPSKKEFDLNPDKYQGHLGTTAQIMRTLLTGRNQTPDLYEVMQVLGIEKITKRLQKHV